jgi:succinate dehydrogenase / fumarate reductase flavoprotein subunit
MNRPLTRTRPCNVLVIGTGGAGLRAAIAARQAGVDVVVIGKRRRLDAHTVLAAGGINAALATVDPEDSWQQHFADTMREGYYLSDPRVVEIMTREAPAAINELADWGCPFARTSDGKLDQRYFGAHTYRRTCYAGDYTGRAVLSTLAEQVQKLAIPIIEDQYVARLLTADGQCFGAIAFDLHTGERTVFEADAVVLCSGGHTRIWRRSSSRRDENYGEGMWLAFQAGARLMDMELVQFHPTGMLLPEEAAGTLVTEAVRGEGGRLLNAQGERFMHRYDPQRMELSSRDRIALANYTEIMEGRGGPNGGVFLDVTHLGKDVILEKLPRMYRQFVEYQMLDIAKEPMEVAPTAHYSMGGIVVDPPTHATGVAGLYAAGECTAGLHGANRLGGNSLVETLVFGRRAGEAAARFSRERESQLRSRRAVDEAHDHVDSLIHNGSELSRALQRAVRDVMWEYCGVVREASDMTRALAMLDEIRSLLPRVDVRPSEEGWGDLASVLDVHAMLGSGEATLRGAIAREDTRGAHIRSDFPALDPTMEVNLVVAHGDDGHMALETTHLPGVPEELTSWLPRAGEKPAPAGGLLE